MLNQCISINVFVSILILFTIQVDSAKVSIEYPNRACYWDLSDRGNTWDYCDIPFNDKDKYYKECVKCCLTNDKCTGIEIYIPDSGAGSGSGSGSEYCAMWYDNACTSEKMFQIPEYDTILFVNSTDMFNPWLSFGCERKKDDMGTRWVVALETNSTVDSCSGKCINNLNIYPIDQNCTGFEVTDGICYLWMDQWCNVYDIQPMYNVDTFLLKPEYIVNPVWSYWTISLITIGCTLVCIGCIGCMVSKACVKCKGNRSVYVESDINIDTNHNDNTIRIMTYATQREIDDNVDPIPNAISREINNSDYEYDPERTACDGTIEA